MKTKKLFCNATTTLNAIVRVVLVFSVALFFVSCSNEYKAKRFIKHLEGGFYALLTDVNSETACVYYAKDNIFYKYDVNTEESTQLLNLPDSNSNYLCHNCNVGIGDIYYLTDKMQVMCHNLKTNTETCLNNHNGVLLNFVMCHEQHLLFYNSGENVDCNERILDYDARTLTSKYVTFDNIDEEFAHVFVPIIFIGHYGLMINLSPENNDEGFDLSKYLYHYSFEGSLVGELNLLCQTEDVWYTKEDDKWFILAMKDRDTVVKYNLYGTVEKEFPSMSGWMQHRGLNSGNLIAQSMKHRVLCYIANDDNNLVSSVYLYYYDANIGEECKINKFVKPSGENVYFTIGTEERKHIYKTSDNAGLVFCGTTDWGEESALLYFDFATKTVQVIDRGVIVYTRDRFKVEHHNGTTQWYDKNGQKSQPRSSFYDMGADFGSFLNMF